MLYLEAPIALQPNTDHRELLQAHGRRVMVAVHPTIHGVLACDKPGVLSLKMVFRSGEHLVWSWRDETTQAPGEYLGVEYRMETLCACPACVVRRAAMGPSDRGEEPPPGPEPSWDEVEAALAQALASDPKLASITSPRFAAWDV